MSWNGSSSWPAWKPTTHTARWGWVTHKAGRNKWKLFFACSFVIWRLGGLTPNREDHSRKAPVARTRLWVEVKVQRSQGNEGFDVLFRLLHAVCCTHTRDLKSVPLLSLFYYHLHRPSSNLHLSLCFWYSSYSRLFKMCVCSCMRAHVFVCESCDNDFTS